MQSITLNAFASAKFALVLACTAPQQLMRNVYPAPSLCFFLRESVFIQINCLWRTSTHLHFELLEWQICDPMRLQSSSRHHSRFPSSLVSVMRIFFPALLLFWLFFFTYAKPAPTHQLRGSQHFELPPLPYGDKSQTLIRKATSEVRRKIIAPNHAIIVAGHAVVRLNKMSSAGVITSLVLNKFHQQIKEE